QASADDDFDTLRAARHRPRHRLLDRAAERHTPLQLLRDAASHEIRIQFRLADLVDVDAYPLARRLLQLRAQLIDVRAAPSDHDAGLRRVDHDRQLVRVPVDINLRDARVDAPPARLHDPLADGDVLVQQFFVVLVCEPLALPVVDDTDAKPCRVDFVTQNYCSSSTITVT